MQKCSEDLCEYYVVSRMRSGNTYLQNRVFHGTEHFDRDVQSSWACSSMFVG